MQTDSFKKIRFIVYVGMMAAICFAATCIKLPFAAPGATSPFIHLGSTACFMAAILLGGLGGGLAGGIGMSLYDIIFGYGFISAIFTFVIKFLTGYVTGKIAWSCGKKGEKLSFNFIACIFGGIVSLVGYCLEAFILTVIAAPPGSSAIQAGIGAAGLMAISSLFTSVLGIVIAPLISEPLKKALSKANLLH